MNKLLLGWNLVLTVLLVGLAIGGCAAQDPRYDNLNSKVEQNRALIEQAINQANENRQLIDDNQALITQTTVSLSTLQQATDAAIASLQATIQQWVQAYVQQVLEQQ